MEAEEGNGAEGGNGAEEMNGREGRLMVGRARQRRIRFHSETVKERPTSK